jgi:hypothetical protein
MAKYGKSARSRTHHFTDGADKARASFTSPEALLAQVSDYKGASAQLGAYTDPIVEGMQNQIKAHNDETFGEIAKPK